MFHNFRIYPMFDDIVYYDRISANAGIRERKANPGKRKRIYSSPEGKEISGRTRDFSRLYVP